MQGREGRAPSRAWTWSLLFQGQHKELTIAYIEVAALAPLITSARIILIFEVACAS